MVAALGSMAQTKGTAAIGADLLYGTEVERAGLGIKMQYNVSDPIRLEADWQCYFRDRGYTFWTVNLNAQYLISLAPAWKFYPLAGLGVCYCGWQHGDSSSKVGFNIGAGLQYDLTDNLFAAIEAKYQYFSHWDQGIFGIGIGYRF